MPKYVSSDNDPLYRFHRWQANLPVLEVTEIKSIPYVPLWLANCYFARDKSDNQNVTMLHGVENLPPNQFARDRPQFHLLESR